MRGPIRVHAGSDRSEPPQVGQVCRTAASTARLMCGCRLLQRCENAPIVRQGRTLLAPGSADWTLHITYVARRVASPLLQTLVFGTHRREAPALTRADRWVIPP